MTEQELNIIVKLKNHHRGKERAIHFKELAINLRLNDRELRDTIANLITDHQIPIGSSQEGYFYITNDDDYQLAHSELISRIKKLARRAKGMRLGYAKSKQYEEPKQLVML
jgi:hypothetical protein